MESIKYAYKNAAWPCFITATTTAVGFISFIAVPIIPVRNLGIVSGISVLLTYLLVMTIIPIFLSIGKDRIVNEKNIKKSRLQEFMSNWAVFSVKNWKIIGILTLIITGIFLFFAFKIRVDTDTIRIVGERSQFIKDAKYITGKLGAIYSYEVLIELPENDMVKNPEILKSLDSLITLINKKETTKLTTSVNNLIKDINMTMNNNDKLYFKIPDKKNLIAQYMLLYEMSGGEELYNYIDYDGKFLRISVQANKYSTKLRKTFEEIKEYGKHIFPENTKINITGDTALSINSIGLLVDGQILSIILAVCGITIMMMLILKSVPAGLLSMIPNILPLVIMTGLMGLLKIPIDAHTVIAAPLLIGIAVDDTVHYFLHFRQERMMNNDFKISNIITFNKIGWALIYTSVILALGFASFLFTSIDAVNNYGLIFIVGIISALLSDLLISPVLCVVLKLFRKIN